MTSVRDEAPYASRRLSKFFGCHVEIAANGEEALNLFNSGEFDVVVTDYRMPRMNGAELIMKIRAVKPEARIILLSGFVEPLGLTEQNTGANAVIAKSSSEPTHLVRSVKRLLHPATRRKPPASQTTAERSMAVRNLSQ